MKYAIWGLSSGKYFNVENNQTGNLKEVSSLDEAQQFRTVGDAVFAIQCSAIHLGLPSTFTVVGVVETQPTTRYRQVDI